MIRKKVKINQKTSSTFKNVMKKTNDIDLSWKRYTDIKKVIQEYIKILFIINKNFNDSDLSSFIEEVKDMYKNYFIIIEIDKSKKAQVKSFFATYNSGKSHVVFDKIEIILKNLSNYAKNINMRQYNFIVNMPGVDWSPLGEVSKINIKELFINNYDDTHKLSYFIDLIYTLFNLSEQLVEYRKNYDFNLDNMTEIVRNSILNMKNNVPELKNCTEAFNKILSSIHLFKDNFKTYYNDYIESKDESMILQNFILDIVSKENSEDKILINQFTKIIEHYKKITKEKSKQRSKNSKTMNSMFDDVTKKLDILRNSNVIKIKEEDVMETVEVSKEAKADIKNEGEVNSDDSFSSSDEEIIDAEAESAIKTEHIDTIMENLKLI